MEIFRPRQTEMPPLCRTEVLRYLKQKQETEESAALLDKAILEARQSICPAVCYAEFSLTHIKGGITFANIRTESKDLIRYFTDCNTVVIFAATIGTPFERLLQKHNKLSPATTLFLDAVGDERIEALCDLFCENIEKRYKKTGHLIKPRYSPGYGDAPLSLQKQIFDLLQCHRHIGLTLTDGFLMSPTKSVTAFVAIKESLDRK